LAAVAVEGGDADQGCGLAAPHPAQFRHADQQGGGDDGADARQGDQQAVAGQQVRMGLDRCQDLARQAQLQGLQGADLGPEGGADILERHVLQEGLQLHQLVGDLLVGRHAFGQFRQPRVLG